jgi:hypothetical protein
MRRVLEHPGAPTVAAALVGMAYLLAEPATADMAAHTFRAWLWEQAGFTAWNSQWYGGHHMAGYSLLFGPLAGLLGPRLLGVLAGVAAVALFAPLARAAAPSRATGAWAAWLFVGGAMSNVVIGRMPFALGLALAVAAWACARRGTVAWSLAAAACSLATVWASPPAGLFLAVSAAGLLLGGDRADRTRSVLVLAGPAVAGGLLMARVFPEGGTDRFVATAFWPTLAACVAGLALIDPRRRALWAGIALYVAVLVFAFAVPGPVGQNALRPAVILGPPLLVLAARSRAARPGVVVVVAALVYLQWLPAVRATAEAHGDPAVQAAFHGELVRFLRDRARPGERLEVPLTRNHWEVAHLARTVPLARGWHRQLDRKVNPLFYEDGPLSERRYSRWLRANAVRWVALPAAPLDFSAREEAALLLEGGAPFLRLAYASPRWLVWEVRDARAPVSGPARLVSARADGFVLYFERAGRAVVRERHTPYWSVTAPGACVRATAGGWTAVTAAGEGPVRVRARFSVDGVLRPRPAACSQAEVPG